MKILVTGASGFIGSFLVKEGINLGFDIWAGIRNTSSKKYLQDKRIQFAELDFGDLYQLKKQLKDHKREHEGWIVLFIVPELRNANINQILIKSTSWQHDILLRLYNV